ncbi:MAG: HEPN domain-containing protein [Candidatus Hydrogenedentes bacterium]|nr:HEPN domain-containing protein [Candidatus Hydrogenedentota bacterium]
MSALDQARVFLIKAREDLDLLEIVASNPKAPDSIFGFHAQQAVEKAIKSWIWALGTKPQRTHDIEALTALLVELNGSPIPELDVLQDIGVFAVLYRYEIFDWDETIDRSKLIADIALLFARVENVLSQRDM